eukprot:803876-Prorocentrum_minimum.AAC.2
MCARSRDTSARVRPRPAGGGGTAEAVKAAPPNVEERLSSLDRAVSALRNLAAEIWNRSIEQRESIAIR